MVRVVATVASLRLPPSVSLERRAGWPQFACDGAGVVFAGNLETGVGASGTPALFVSSERRSSAEADNVLPAFVRDKLESDDEDDEHAAG